MIMYGSFGVGRHGLERLAEADVTGRVPPDVALRVPGDVGPGAADDQASLDRGRCGQRLVGGRLHRHRLAAPREAVGGDQQRGLAVGEAAGDRIGAVAGEDRDVDRAELADGEDRDHRLGDHRQEDADPVAAPDAQRRASLAPPGPPAQRSCARGEVAHLAVLPLPGQRQLVGSCGGGLVDRHAHVVEARAAEPAGPFDAAGRVQDRARLRIEPNPDVRHGGLPEPGRVGHGAGLERFEVLAAGGARRKRARRLRSR